MPTVAPSWKKYEEKMHSDDVKEAKEAGDAFINEREWETSHNNQLAEWEKGRVEHIAKQKPAWVKKQAQEEKSKSQNELHKFLEAGNIDYNIIPARGYILVEILSKKETKTASGIVLSSEEIPNEIALVLDVGDELILDKNTIPAPCYAEDIVLLKKMAGLEVTSRGRNLRICLFSDVLAILEE